MVPDLMELIFRAGFGNLRLCAKSSLLPVCVEHSYTHLFMYYLWQVSCYKRRVECYDRNYDQQSLQIVYLNGNFYTFFKFADPVLVVDITRTFFSHFFFWKARLLIHVNDRISYYIYYIPVKILKFHALSKIVLTQR